MNKADTYYEATLVDLDLAEMVGGILKGDIVSQPYVMILLPRWASARGFPNCQSPSTAVSTAMCRETGHSDLQWQCPEVGLRRPWPNAVRMALSH